MTRKLGIAAVGAVLCLMAGSVPASAGVLTLNFNSLASGADSTAIKTYIDGQLSGAATVTVSGGALADKGYSGDGHVVGVGASTVSRTLGTSEGRGGMAAGTSCPGPAPYTCIGPNLDTFLRNAPNIASFYFDFSNNFIIDSVSFDYEIFPDASCQVLNTTSCGALSGGHYANQPDFTFSTDLGTVLHTWSATPVGNTHSPVSGAGNELTPQMAPINTGALVFNVAGSNVLTFADWPATIGIDNLIINWHTPGSSAAVPEPASLLLLGTGLLGGLRARARRRQRSAS
jgi:hypothetical protein